MDNKYDREKFKLIMHTISDVNQNIEDAIALKTKLYDAVNDKSKQKLDYSETIEITVLDALNLENALVLLINRLNKIGVLEQ